MTEHTPDWHCYNTGCREPGCREAWRTYAATHRRAQAYGRKPRLTMIDAAPVLATVDSLIRGGVSESTIARSAGIGASTIWRARKAGRIRSDVAARIRAFTIETADLLPRSRIDGTGTRQVTRPDTGRHEARPDLELTLYGTDVLLEYSA